MLKMCRPKFIYLSIGILLMGKAHANPRYTATPSPHDVISVEMLRLRKQRISYVRHVLNERFHYVESGKRGKEFTKWIQEKGGATILSTHGLDIDDAVLDVMSAEKPAVLDLSERTLFPEDKRDLGLVSIVGVPRMFPGQPIHLIDDRPPSFPRLLGRFVVLSVKFAPITTTMWLAILSSKFREKLWYKWLSTCLSSSGPAFIKWGQWAATRSDMFPEALCDELQHLHNAAPAHSWSFTQKMMESSLGLPRHSLLEVFDWFDPTPVASGSIAQVHKAILRGDGSDEGVLVAVKVRHPHVAQLIDMDFRIMAAMARMFDCIPSLSRLHVRESVEQFSHTMAAQAHLNVEAHHLEVLNDNFRKWGHVRFPQPFYSSSSVIIETYEPGAAVSKILDTYDALAADISSEVGTVSVEEVDEDGGRVNSQGHGYELIPVKLAKFIVTTGLSIYLKMLLTDNLMVRL
jgi:ABC1 atypical kinase-like domain